MKRWIGCYVLLFALAACGHSIEDKDHASMNRLPLHKYCIGRVSIDIPGNSFVTWTQRVGDAAVERLPLKVNTPEAFWKVVEQRRDNLASQKHNTEPSLLSSYERIGDRAALLLFRGDAAQDETYHIDRYVWLGNWGYQFKTDATMAANAKSSMTLYKEMLYQLKPIDNSQSFIEPGFCIDGALITGSASPLSAGPSIDGMAWRGVSAYIGVREPVDLNDADTAFRDLEDVEEGIKENMSSSKPDRVASFEVLRKRTRSENGFPGQEVIFRATLANGQIYYRFRWETLPEGAGLKQGIVMGLDSGKPMAIANYVAPPPEDALFALWDAMVDSVKMRANGAR